MALVVTTRGIKWFLVLRFPLTPHIKHIGLRGKGELMLDLSIMTLLVPGPEVSQECLSKLSQAPRGSPKANTHSE